jgi:hypothetical protein
MTRREDFECFQHKEVIKVWGDHMSITLIWSFITHCTHVFNVTLPYKYTQFWKDHSQMVYNHMKICLSLLVIKNLHSRCRWPTHVILTTREAKIRRIVVQRQPRKIVCENPISKITRAKWTEGVAQEQSTCFTSVKAWVQTPVQPKAKQNHANWSQVRNCFILMN